MCSSDLGVNVNPYVAEAMTSTDAARIEVLRGPQGTLYGRGAFGGLVNVITNDPSDKYEGKVFIEGGAYSINVRIVKPTDPPLLHANSLDIWLVQAGSATAVTGGELLDVKKRPNSDDAAGTSIKGGVEQPLKAGDVLYVPAGVPHGFKDINGFRAFLIRFDTK